MDKNTQFHNHQQKNSLQSQKNSISSVLLIVQIPSTLKIELHSNIEVGKNWV